MNTPGPVARLPGMADTGSGAIQRRDRLAQSLQQQYSLRGYERVDTPLLEATELFIRRSGGDLSSRLYSFTEPGGYEVSLRPEFTAPVLRLACSNDNLATPARYQYAGPVFRYPTPLSAENADPAEFWQLGAELIGSPSAAAEGEIIAMALEGLEAAGAPEGEVSLGDVGLMWQALEPFGLMDRARLFLVNSVGNLKDSGGAVDGVREDARRMGLISDRPIAASVSRFTGGREGALALVDSVLEEVLQANGFFAGNTRSKDEIAGRLARKLTEAEDSAKFEDALRLLADLAALNGTPDAAFSAAGDALRGAGQSEEPLKNLARVVEAAKAEGVPAKSIRIDLGLARGIAYYTGAVFDVSSGARTVGGGGRYDGLTKALDAKRDIPSLGFAFNLNALLETVPPSGDGREGVLVVAADRRASSAAAGEAARLRRQKVRAVLEFDTPPDRESLIEIARNAGCTRVDIVDADGAARRETLS